MSNYHDIYPTSNYLRSKLKKENQQQITREEIDNQHNS